MAQVEHLGDDLEVLILRRLGGRLLLSGLLCLNLPAHSNVRLVLLRGRPPIPALLCHCGGHAIGEERVRNRDQIGQLPLMRLNVRHLVLREIELVLLSQDGEAAQQRL